MKIRALSVISVIFCMSLPAWAATESGSQQAASTTKGSISDFTSFKVGDSVAGKFNVLLQGWSVQNEKSTANDQNLRLRRSEFKLSGSVADATKYFMMVDPAKLIPPPNGKTVPTNNMIQDFGLTYVIVPNLEFTAGQFKIPTTAEGLDSSSELPLPERSVVGRTLGDKREMGVKLGFKQPLWSAATMLSSGRAVYTHGEGAFHDLDTRVELTPMKNLGFGTFLVMGNDFDYSKKGRWGINGRYSPGKAVLRAEYAQGKDGPVHSNGITTEAGYWITENLQPVARFETFSPSQAAGNTGKAETLGLSYHVRSYFTKLQLAGSIMQNMAAVNGSPTVVKGVHNKEVTFALQTSI